MCAGDVGALAVAHHDRVLRAGSERCQRGLEDARRRLAPTDFRRERHRVEVPLQADKRELGVQRLDAVWRVRAEPESEPSIPKRIQEWDRLLVEMCAVPPGLLLDPEHLVEECVVQLYSGVLVGPQRHRNDIDLVQRTTLLVLVDLTFDTVTRQGVRGDSTCELSAREFRLLEFLMQNAGKVVNAALAEGKDLRTVVLELGLMTEDDADKALDVLAMTRGGIVGV